MEAVGFVFFGFTMLKIINIRGRVHAGKSVRQKQSKNKKEKDVDRRDTWRL